jgi:hypothetical protein
MKEKFLDFFFHQVQRGCGFSHRRNYGNIFRSFEIGNKKNRTM